MYFVYILSSQTAKKTYVGHTKNPERRLNEHNSGKTIFSRRYKPWEILYIEKVIREADAIKRERYFKSAAGRRWMKKNFFKNK